MLRQSGHLTAESRFGTITVEPRSKARPEPRAARVLGFDWSRNEGFVAVVDVDAGRVESWTVVDSEPPMRLLIIRRAEEAAHADPRWVAALQKRHIDTARVSVLVGMPERAKLPRRGTDRVVPAFVWLRDGPPEALSRFAMCRSSSISRAVGWMRSPRTAASRRACTDSASTRALASPRAPLAPLNIQQQGGSSVRIAGNEISWDRWHFRVGVDPRRGLEVHDVSFTDGARRRSVLYSGSVAEIVAPYGDPSFSTWYPRDEGDYGMGIYSQSSAVALNDVPANAAFLTATMHDYLGRPIAVPRAIAVYERDGGILWRHANMSRRARQLVVSGHSTIDNYDYQFNWIFSQDGAIDGEVLLSGIMNINGTRSHDRHGPRRRPRDRSDISSRRTSTRRIISTSSASDWISTSMARRTPSTPSTRALPRRTIPKGELFAMNVQPLATERDAMSDVSFSTARNWQVANTHATNALGQFTAYTLVPSTATPAFALAASAPLRTAGFVAHQLWVTPYHADRAILGGRVSESRPRWRRLAEVDGGQSIAQRYGRRSMVHARHHAHPAAGGLAVHAGASRRISLASDVVLRSQSDARRPAALKTHL